MTAAAAIYYPSREVALVPMPQTAMETGFHPSRACTPFPQGLVPGNSVFWVRTLGKKLVSQHEIAASWPDGSVKWLHSHFLIEYLSYRPKQSVLCWGPSLPDGLPRSSLSVVDSSSQITIQTGAATVIVPRPFRGLSSYIVNGQQLIDGSRLGGPSLIDQDNQLWEAWRDTSGTVEVESVGAYRVVIKASGWYQRTPNSATPFCQYVTRITLFNGSPLVQFDHTVIFSADMWEHQLTAIGFKFFTPQAFNYAARSDGSLLRGSFKTTKAIWHAQLTDRDLYQLMQTNAANDDDVAPVAIDEQSEGWFMTQRNNTMLAMLTKDFWQKYPKEVKVGQDELTYYSWPKHGDLLPDDPDLLDLDQLYKFECFQRGKFLDGKLPDEYYTALQNQSEATEALPEYARDSNMSGVAMRSKFALYATPASGDFIGRIAEQQRLFQVDPVARIWPEAVGETDALGPCKGMGVLSTNHPYKPYMDVAIAGVVGANHSAGRFRDYGWANYGNIHHDELMSAAYAGVANGRPSLHRVWNNNHYQHGSTCWRLWGLTDDVRLLQQARLVADHYASILQVVYDNPNEFRPGGDTPPRTRWHDPGAFYHCKAFVQWGGRAYNSDNNDADSGPWGHWIDPTCLLLAWLMDGDPWAKDAYDRWRANFYLPDATYRKREFNTTLKHLLEWHEYEPDNAAVLSDIQTIMTDLPSAPLVNEAPGPIWEPTWLSHYHEVFPEDDDFIDYLLTSAAALGVLGENIWTYALSATAYDLTSDASYLHRLAGTLSRALRAVFVDPDANKLWDGFGWSPGPARDFHYSLQLPRLLRAMENAGLTELNPIAETGQFWNGGAIYNNATDVTNRGTLIYAYRAAGGDPDPSLDFQLDSIFHSTPDAMSVKVLSPADAVLLDVARLNITNGSTNPYVRASSWLTQREQHAVAAAGTGLYKIKLGSGYVGIFGPLVNLPTAQVLRRENLSTTGSPQYFVARVSSGYMKPRVSTPIDLTFKAFDYRRPSYLKVTASDDQIVYDGWLRSGTSVTLTMNSPGGKPTPWFVEVSAEFSGYTELRITAQVDEPLLFGHNLSHLNTIHGLLG